MKAFLIDAQNQTIEDINIDSMDDIAKIIGYETIESEVLGDSGDRLFFDEECFIRGSVGRFQLDKLIPVSGRGLLLGADEAGTTLSDVNIDRDDLVNRIKYL